MSLGASQLAALRIDWSNFGPVAVVLVGIGVALVVLAYTRGLRGRGRAARNRFLLLGLRLGAIACLLAALLHPMWVWRKADLDKPAVAVVLDNSLSMSLPAEGEAGPSRYERALDVLRSRIVPKLGQSAELRCYDASGSVLDLAALPAAPKGERSPLTESLARVQRALRARKLAGIILLSDGAESDDSRSGAGGLKDVHAAVYPVELARQAAAGVGPSDLSIQAVIANQRALAGNAVKVTVLMGATGRIDARNVEVTISDERSVVARKIIRWHAGEMNRGVDLDFQASRPGKLTYTVDVRAQDASAGPGHGPAPGASTTAPGAEVAAAPFHIERNLGNNRAWFPLAVRVQPFTVLYIDGVLRWEGKFMREALAGDPDLNVLSSVRTAARSAGGKSRGILTKEQLANVKVVILGDIEPGYFAEAELSALKSWVSDGGGLLLTGGYLGFGPDGFGTSVLRDVLPVDFVEDEKAQIDTPFNLRLTEEGEGHPIFHITGDRVRDRAVWHSLPQLAGCSRIKGIKPGAQVLAVNPGVSGGDNRQGLPVMVSQQVGRGRSMVWAVDTTWKWRTIVGGFTGETLFYRKFWGQLVRFLAAGEDEASAERLFVSTDRYRYKEGQDVKLLVEVRGGEESRPGSSTRPSLPAKVDWRVSALCVDEEGRRTRVGLASAGQDRHEAKVPAARPGRMDFLVTAEPIVPAVVKRDQDEYAVRTQAVTVQVERPDLELLAGQWDSQWLTRAAQATGGRVLKVDEIDTWRLETEPTAVTRVEQAGLWHHPVLVAAFFVLLCAEWVLRRMRRLA
jgi:uncharacterized membrane protein